MGGEEFSWGALKRGLFDRSQQHTAVETTAYSKGRRSLASICNALCPTFTAGHMALPSEDS
eukprot:2281103-Alexandrium_andersonii.AAC.1